MTRLLGSYRRLLAAVGWVESCVAGALLSTIVVAITMQVFSRYLLGQPLTWVEEFATYAFIWAAFLGASVGMKQLRHVKVEMLSLYMGRRAQSLVRLFAYVVMAAALVMLADKASAVMAIEAGSRSISLPFEISRKWFYSVPLYTACLSMLATVAYYALAEIRAITSAVPVDLVDASAAVEEMA